jgi:thioredoxin-like negative regulator of GroEL
MKPKLTYFYNPECPKCQELKPVIEELKQLFEITSVNTYEEDMLVESLDVKWVPTFMLEDQNGKHKFEGVKEITEFLKKVIL